MHELDPKHRPLAPPPGGDQAASPLGSHSGGCGLEHGLRRRTGAGGDDSPDTRPDHATRWLDEARQRVKGLHSGAGPQRKRRVTGGGRPCGRRRSQTTRGILNYQQLAPLLAERVALAEATLDQEAFGLTPQDATARRDCFLALETADQRDWRPLMDIWRKRFLVAETGH